MVDLNADGSPDLVGLSANILTIQLNNGAGVFTVSQTLTLSISAFSNVLSVGDVNGDGRPDIVITSPGGNMVGGVIVSVLLGNGNGTFVGPLTSNLSTNTGGNPYFAAGLTALGNFHGDGKVDLLMTAASPTTNVVNLLARGDGAGHFSLSYSSTSTGSGNRLFLGDFNKDGKLDYFDGSRIHLGNGDGTFHDGALITQAGQYSDLNGNVFSTLLMADVNRDGNLDIIGSVNNVLSISIGNGDGTFTSSSSTVLGSNGLFAVVDVNRDGIPDLLTTYRGFSVLLGQGNGTFASPVSTSVYGGGLAWGTSVPNQTSVADLDGDGIPDLLDPEAGRYILYSGKGDGTFLSGDLYTLGETGGGVAIGDFNRDGKLDIAASTINPYPRVLLGDGKGSFTSTPDQNAGTTATSGAKGIVTGDFDGDGKLDVLTLGTAFNPNNLTLSFGNGDGSFQAPKPLSDGSLVVGDLNHDGRTDIISSTSSNGSYGIIASLGQTNGSFSQQTSYPLGLNRGLAGLIDFNKDGKPDLFVTGSSSIQTLAGNGDGTFSMLTSLGPLGGPYTPSAIHSADLDGDGFQDVIAEVSNGSQIFYGTAGGGFLAPVLVPTGTSVRIADVDLDGKPDLISVQLTNSLGAPIQVLHNLGNRTFGNADLLVGGVSPNNLEVADLNGDGFPDIVVSSTTTDTVTVLLNRGNAGATTATLAVMPEPSQYKQPITVNVSFAGKSSTQLPTGSVACDLDALSIGTATLSNGSAVITGSPSSTAGKRVVTCRYTGDKTYTASSVSVPHTVTYDLVPVTISLTASPAAVLTSQTVRLVASLSSSMPVLGGTVVFTDADTGYAIGGSLVSNNSIAQVDTNLLSVGTHHLIAQYLGYDNSYTQISLLPAKSSAVSVTVSAHATSTVLALSNNNSAAGTPLTLAATVSTTDGSSPFGSVTFFDGSTTLGTALLTAGKATWSTSFPTSGAHILRASFQATETFAASSSSTSSYQSNVISGSVPGAVALTFTSGATANLSAIIASSQSSSISMSGHSIAFFDGGSYLGSALTQSNGVATLSLAPSPTQAARNFYAVLQANSSLLAFQTPTLLQSDTDPATFTLTPGARSVILHPLQRTTLPLNATWLSSSAPMDYACSSSTASAFCQISGTADAPTLILFRPQTASTASGSKSLATFLAVLLCATFGAATRRRTRLLTGPLLVALTAALITSLIACSSVAPTPAELSVVTVRATATVNAQQLIHTQQVLVSLPSQ